jgi:hypothetical protein
MGTNYEKFPGHFSVKTQNINRTEFLEALILNQARIVFFFTDALCASQSEPDSGVS